MKLGRAHEWYTHFVAYEATEKCGRCGVLKNAAPRNCLTDGELAERKAWRNEAEKAAEAFARRKRLGGLSAPLSQSPL